MVLVKASHRKVIPQDWGRYRECRVPCQSPGLWYMKQQLATRPKGLSRIAWCQYVPHIRRSLAMHCPYRSMVSILNWTRYLMGSQCCHKLTTLVHSLVCELVFCRLCRQRKAPVLICRWQPVPASQQGKQMGFPLFPVSVVRGKFLFVGSLVQCTPGMKSKGFFYGRILGSAVAW